MSISLREACMDLLNARIKNNRKQALREGHPRDWCCGVCCGWLANYGQITLKTAARHNPRFFRWVVVAGLVWFVLQKNHVTVFVNHVKSFAAGLFRQNEILATSLTSSHRHGGKERHI